MKLDTDTFLTTVYGLVDDRYREQFAAAKPVRPGPAPRLSDSAVLTLLLLAQWQADRQERAFLRHAHQHWRGYFPALAGVPLERRWAGTLALTLDRVCSMGVGGEAHNVYHALGYSGHGVALALLAGRVLADLYDGNHDAWREQPFYQKRLLPMPPEPLRWLGYQAYTRLTGRSPRR